MTQFTDNRGEHGIMVRTLTHTEHETMTQHKYNAEHGPQVDTISDGTQGNQSAFFEELKLYNLTDELAHGCDFFKVAEIEGIKYYLPNDETWGGIIAVSEEHELAIYTGFYEMDDMGYPGSDYRQIVKDGVMGCAFTFESWD